MTIDRNTEYLLSLLNELRKLPRETEWVEFKHYNNHPDETAGSKAKKYLTWWA